MMYAITALAGENVAREHGCQTKPRLRCYVCSRQVRRFVGAAGAGSLTFAVTAKVSFCYLCKRNRDFTTRTHVFLT